MCSRLSLTFLSLGAGLLLSSSPLTQEKNDRPGDAVAPLPEWIVLEQRKVWQLPGAQGLLRLHIDDITGGQTKACISILGEDVDAGSILSQRSMQPGEVRSFRWQGQTYYIGLVRLVNFLIGRDYAEFELTRHPEQAASRLALPRRAVALEEAALPNLLKVSDRIYCGPKPDAAGFARLRELGVRTLVSLGSKHGYAAAAGRDVEVARVPMEKPFDDVDALVHCLKVLHDPKRSAAGAFYLCGSDGPHQAFFALAAYRLAANGFTRDEALCELMAPGRLYVLDWYEYVRALQTIPVQPLLAACDLGKERRELPVTQASQPPLKRWLGEYYRDLPGFAELELLSVPLTKKDEEIAATELWERMRSDALFEQAVPESLILREDRAFVVQEIRTNQIGERWIRTGMRLRALAVVPGLRQDAKEDVLKLIQRTLDENQGKKVTPIKTGERFRAIVRLGRPGRMPVILHSEKIEDR